jgi:hypothetical protein
MRKRAATKTTTPRKMARIRDVMRLFGSKREVAPFQRCVKNSIVSLAGDEFTAKGGGKQAAFSLRKHTGGAEEKRRVIGGYPS